LVLIGKFFTDVVTGISGKTAVLVLAIGGTDVVDVGTILEFLDDIK
jgi:hypothetical protein